MQQVNGDGAAPLGGESDEPGWEVDLDDEHPGSPAGLRPGRVGGVRDVCVGQLTPTARAPNPVDAGTGRVRVRDRKEYRRGRGQAPVPPKRSL
jgi:hypothetical protein